MSWQAHERKRSWPTLRHCPTWIFESGTSKTRTVTATDSTQRLKEERRMSKVFRKELAACHISGVQNFDVGPSI